MKKRHAVSLVVSFSMLIGLITGGVLAAGNDDISGGRTKAPAQKVYMESAYPADASWQNLGTGGSLGTENAENYYKLADDISGNIQIKKNATVYLDLNGYTISDSEAESVISFSGEGAVLNLYDSVGTGTISGKNGITMGQRNCTVNMYGGMICGCTSHGIYLNASFSSGQVQAHFNLYDGSVCNNQCTGVQGEYNNVFTMYGGSIHDNRTTGNGGGINTNDGYIFVYGGEIYNNTATGDGGGICTNTRNGFVYLENVEIYGNSASNGGGVASVSVRGSGKDANENNQLRINGAAIRNNTATGFGGGVYQKGYNFAQLEKCMITENTAGEKNGAGYYYQGGHLSVKGEIVIRDNHTTDAEDSNLYIGSYKDDKLYFIGELDSASEIYFDSDKTNASITSGLTSEDILSSLIYEGEDGRNVTFKSGELQISNDLAARLAGYKVRLDGYVGVDYYVQIMNRDLRKTSTTVSFIIDSKVEEYKTQECTYNAQRKATIDGTEYYIFTCRIPVAEINLPITAELKNGTTKIVFPEFAVRDYAQYIAEDVNNQYDEKTKDVAKTLLNYGYYAQQYFSIGSPAQEDMLSLTSPSVTPATVTTTEDITYKGSSIVFLDGARIKHYFDVGDHSIGDYKFFIDGAEVQTTESGNRYYISTSAISVQDAATPHTVRIEYNGSVVAEYTYSANNYVAAVLASSSSEKMKNLVKSYYMYYQAASAFVSA